MATEVTIKTEMTTGVPGSGTILSFRDVQYDVQVTRGGGLCKSGDVETKTILKGVTGCAQPGETLAIMGPSGSGKTSLLNILCGARSMTSGHVALNGSSVPADLLAHITSFVQQDDCILQTMTVREAIMLEAMLRLPKAWTKQEKVARAMEVISTLHLEKTLDTFVGSPENYVHGISGGERKRLSVSMAMLTNPGVLILDEPTSGLDSFIAFTLISSLAKLAATGGRTVVLTIHQPSSELFSQFDSLLLLLNGNAVYYGPTDRSVEYFEAVSPLFKCPTFHNPPDFFFMNVLHDASAEVDGESMAPSDAAELSTQRDHARHMLLTAAWEGSREFAATRDLAYVKEGAGVLSGSVRDMAAAAGVDGLTGNAPSAGFGLQFLLLAQRALRNIVRDKMRLRANVAQGCVVALIFGVLWLDVPNNQAGLQDRTGVLFMVCVETFMSAMMGVLATFANERSAISREMGHGLYQVPAYFTSKVAVEAILAVVKPLVGSNILYWMVGLKRTATNYFTYLVCQIVCLMVGMSCGYSIAAAFKTLAMALSIAPVMFMPMMVFAGLFNNLNDLPAGVSYLQYLSPIKYIYSALMQNELRGLELTLNANGSGFATGDLYLESLYLDEFTIWECWVILAAVYFGLLSISFVMLRKLGRAT